MSKAGFLRNVGLRYGLGCPWSVHDIKSLRGKQAGRRESTHEESLQLLIFRGWVQWEKLRQRPLRWGKNLRHV